MEFITERNVGYTWYLTGPQGAHFVLHPLRGRHSLEDLKAARRQLRAGHDVVSLRVEWVDSYRGELFRMHRAYVVKLKEWKRQVAQALKVPENRQRFLAATFSEQRYYVWALMDKGYFKWSIKPA